MNSAQELLWLWMWECKLQGWMLHNQQVEEMLQATEKELEMAERVQITKDNVEEVFTYHSWDKEQETHGVKVKDALVNAAKVILDEVPDSPDKTVALRKLREARMDCNSAITHHGKF